jgi:hypothetical protein
MHAHDIKIGGILIPWDAAHSLSQSYEPITGRHLMRLADGSAVLQQSWAPKLRTSIRGEGRYPDQLSAVDWSASFEIQCAAPLAIHSSGTAVTLPAARRTDWAPFAKALVDGVLVSTSLSIVVNAGTIGAVAGATSYLTYYFPKLTCFAVMPPSRGFNARGPDAGWELIAEET